MRRKSEVSRRLLLLLVSGLGTLLLLEVVARIYASATRKSPVYESDGVFGWRLIPNNDVVRLDAFGEFVDFRTDEHGYRYLEFEGDALDRSDVFRHPGRQKRVLVIGDSFSEGYIVPLEHRFDVRMEHATPDWSVSAVGVAGYSFSQQYLLLQKYKNQLQAGDVVVLQTCGNDFLEALSTSDVWSRRLKPSFSLENGDIVLRGPGRGVINSVRDSSYLVSFLVPRINAWTRPVRWTLTGAELERAVAIYVVFVRKIQAELDAIGVELYVAFNGSAYLDDYEAVVQEVGELPDFPPSIELDQYLGEVTRENPNFSNGDPHWSSAGHGQVAQRLAAFIEESGRAGVESMP